MQFKILGRNFRFNTQKLLAENVPPPSQKGSFLRKNRIFVTFRFNTLAFPESGKRFLPLYVVRQFQMEEESWKSHIEYSRQHGIFHLKLKF
jgi:hypothetical protein